MELTKNDLRLRDFEVKDIDDEIRWMNEEVTWMEADSPWVSYEKVDGDKLREQLIEMIIDRPENAPRWRLEIEKNGKHIGFVSSYFLTSDLENVDWNKVDESKSLEENGLIRALGIEICEPSYWCNGIGTEALSMFIEYYKNMGEKVFALETWSGNKRMIRCSEKLGFKEAKRDEDAFHVNGNHCDAIIFLKNL